MNCRHSYLVSRRTDLGQATNDSSLRGRKENVNIQQQVKPAPGLEPVKRRLPVSNSLALGHKRKTSFITKPAAKAIFRPESKALRELHLDPNAGLSPMVIAEPATVECITEVEQQGENAMREYGEEVETYQRELEQRFLAEDCLQKHEITMTLRAKMIDWMVEVLTNFRCNDQTFFLAVNLMDRYLKHKQERKLIGELHIIGVAAMFLASKYEDILPLRIDVVQEKIAHGKLTSESIREYEHDILITLDYFLQAPTVLEFLRRYCKVLSCEKEDKGLITRMALYLAKMSLHDYYFCNVRTSKIAISSVYVALKICEQLRKRSMLSREIVEQMVRISGYAEETILECAQKILTNAQNFDTLFPGLSNLKKTHFSGLMDYIPK